MQLYWTVNGWVAYRTKEVYKLIQSTNRKWKPKQWAIKDKDGKLLMDKDKTKQRWTEYCRNLFQAKDEANLELLGDLRKISPPPTEDDSDNILYD